MKKILAISISLGLASCLFASSHQEELAQAKQMLSTMKPEAIAHDLAAATKTQLPMKVDDISSLTAVFSKGVYIKYTGTIKSEPIPKKLLKGHLAKQKEEQAFGLCSNPFVHAALEKGVIMQYEYFYENKQKLGDTYISIKDCK
jgi:hypothetical protein